MINAWTAGVLPIAQADPAVAEIAGHGVDSVMVPTPASADEVLAAAELLLCDPGLRTSIFERIEAWREVNTTIHFVDQWSALLAELAGMSGDRHRRLMGGALLGSLTQAVHDRLRP